MCTRDSCKTRTGHNMQQTKQQISQQTPHMQTNAGERFENPPTERVSKGTCLRAVSPSAGTNIPCDGKGASEKTGPATRNEAEGHVPSLHPAGRVDHARHRSAAGNKRRRVLVSSPQTTVLYIRKHTVGKYSS